MKGIHLVLPTYGSCSGEWAWAFSSLLRSAPGLVLNCCRRGQEKEPLLLPLLHSRVCLARGTAWRFASLFVFPPRPVHDEKGTAVIFSCLYPKPSSSQVPAPLFPTSLKLVSEGREQLLASSQDWVLATGLHLWQWQCQEVDRGDSPSPVPNPTSFPLQAGWKG